MFTVKTIASTVCDHAVVSVLHQREELPLQHEGHNIHDDFAVAILKNTNTAGMYHGTFPGISCRIVAARWLVSSTWTVATLHLRDDLKLRMCSLDIPEDAHQGAL